MARERGSREICEKAVTSVDFLFFPTALSCVRIINLAGQMCEKAGFFLISGQSVWSTGLMN